MKQPKVAIIISSYNQEELVQRNIMLLEKTEYKKHKIYFVDDSGEGKIAKQIKEKFPKVKIIINSENFGFSKSYNKGINLAKKEYDPEWFLVLNDDCELRDKDWLKNILRASQDKPSGGIFGCKVLYPDGSLQWVSKKGKNYFYKNSGVKEKISEFSEESKTTEILGAFMFMKKKMLEKVGTFDEGFSPFYGEESDLCFRAKKAGFENWYLGSISLIHHRNKSINKISKEKVWSIKKTHSLRLELLNYPFLKLIFFSVIHLGSIFKRDGIKIFKKISLLLKAYNINLKNIKEIRYKREERNKWKNQKFQF